MIRLLLYSCCSLILASCGGSKVLKHIDAEPRYQEAFTGFFLADALDGEVLEALNADKLFTPASNTKLLTLATCLEWLPQDSLPALAYDMRADTLQLWALAYPLLAADNSSYNESIRSFIASWEGPVEINLHGYNSLPRFGEGWMWDDYNYAFARERSGMPFYSNMATAWRIPDTSYTLQIEGEDREITRTRYSSRPDFINAQGWTDVYLGNLNREEFSNRFYVSSNSSVGDTVSAPLYSSRNMIAQLMEDWTGHTTRHHTRPLPRDWGSRTWKGEHRDTLLKAMLHPSDNFLAEQLLLEAGLYAKELTDVKQVLAKAQEEVLQISNDNLAWADGSGVSHYNMVTPRALGMLVQRLSAKHGIDFLAQLLPAGGESGTIAKWYKGPNGKPYIFAKTGTLRHNHCLTGLLQAKSGRWLTFSFMHNHYRGSSKDYKEAMEKTLALIRDTY
ncbi:MAG: D-alanyl-D-alanine carboxypeptidase [Saprospiraceae bacterium]